MFSLLQMAFFRNLTANRSDPRAPLNRRIPRESFAVANIGNMGAKVGSCRFVKGVPVITNVVFLPGDSIDPFHPALIAALRDRSTSGAVVAGISIKGIFNLQKMESLDINCLSGFNGDTRDPHSYAQVLPHPESEKTMRGVIERGIVTQFAEKLREGQMDLVRCQIPSIAILNRMLADPMISSPPEGMVTVPVVCDQGVLHAVAISRGKWIAQRCTTIVSRGVKERPDDEDEEILDVLHSCRRSIDQTYATREGSSRPSLYHFALLDTNTPEMAARVTRVAQRLVPLMPGIKVTVDAFTTDENPDMYCLVHDLKQAP